MTQQKIGNFYQTTLQLDNPKGTEAIKIYDLYTNKFK